MWANIVRLSVWRWGKKWPQRSGEGFVPQKNHKPGVRPRPCVNVHNMYVSRTIQVSISPAVKEMTEMFVASWKCKRNKSGVSCRSYGVSVVTPTAPNPPFYPGRTHDTTVGPVIGCMFTVLSSSEAGFPITSYDLSIYFKQTLLKVWLIFDGNGSCEWVKPNKSQNSAVYDQDFQRNSNILVEPQPACHMTSLKTIK